MSDDEKDGSTIERAIPPAPDKPTGEIPPMERWPSPVQHDRHDPTWTQSGRGAA